MRRRRCGAVRDDEVRDGQRVHDVPGNQAALDAALRLFPRYRAALEERGRLMLDAARPAEALAAFEALLSLAPEQARVRARS